MIEPGKTIGIIGGGQLGRMTALAAANLGYKTHIFCPEANSPASYVAYSTTVAAYDDREALLAFSKAVDVVSFEFENIPHEAVEFLSSNAIVRPNWKSLYIARNRLREKQFFHDIGAAVPGFFAVNSAESLAEGMARLGTKAVLKTSELGYDGKGQMVVNPGDSPEDIWLQLSTEEAILEAFVPFKKEISVITARSETGEICSFPPAENVHRQGILRTSTAPAAIDDKSLNQAMDIARKAVEKLEFVGLLAIEFFVMEDGNVMVNEMAPRPHNSGHWTQDGCVTSQFEQFVRAICGLPFGAVDIIAPTVMENLIGDDVLQWKEMVVEGHTKLHLYGKCDVREGRKMGHVNRISLKSK